MFSERVRNVMESDGLIVMPPDGSVADAARAMVNSPLGAVLVMQGDAIQGIFTPIDAVRRVMAQGLDPACTPLAAVMSSPVLAIDSNWRFGHALRFLHEQKLHQAPVLEQGRPIGMLRARDALDPEMEEFVCEAQRRQGYSAEGG